MNYVLTAYEKGLQRLLEGISEEHPEYGRILTLQTCLRQNINRAQNSRTPEIQCSERMQIMAELNDVMRQVKNTSFIEICVGGDDLLTYLATVYKTVQYGCEVFYTQEQVWYDQCQYISQALSALPALDDSTTDLPGADSVELSHINASVKKLVQHIDDFKRICHIKSKHMQKRKQYIQRKVALLHQHIKRVDGAFDGAIQLYLNEIQLSNQETKQDQGQAPAQPSAQPDTPADSPPPPQNVDPNKLRKAMITAFDFGSLEILCANLNIHYGSLGENLAIEVKIQRLIDYCRQRDIYENLVHEVLKLRLHLKKML